MGRFLVRVEAVNLAASILDTDDLSVIRGGGFANLLLPKRIIEAIGLGALHHVFSGASQAEAFLDTQDGIGIAEIEVRLEQLATGKLAIAGLEPQLDAVLPFLTILGVAVPAVGGYKNANRFAMGKICERQLFHLTVDRGSSPSPAMRRPCMIDGVRPHEAEITKGPNRLAVSKSVATRRKLGRELRQNIYKEIGVRTDRALTYADSFADLVDDDDNLLTDLPPSLKGKMAVVYLDGNKFTAAREKAIADDKIGGGAAAKAFSQTVTKARAKFLDRLLDKLEGDDRMYCDGRFRFEILMWGGDEARFVLPAWKVPDVLSLLAEDMDAPHWQFEGSKLTNAVGILVCHHKTPIARASELADDVVNEIKAHIKNSNSAPQDMLSIQLIESIEPPSGSISGFREKLYGTAEPTAFVINGAAGIKNFIDSYGRITDPKSGLPRSQLYNIIAEARRQGLAGKNPPKNIDRDTLVQDAVKRSRGGSDKDVVDNLTNALKDPVFGIDAHANFVGLVRMAEMWDLMRPFSDDVKDRTEAA